MVFRAGILLWSGGCVGCWIGCGVRCCSCIGGGGCIGGWGGRVGGSCCCVCGRCIRCCCCCCGIVGRVLWVFLIIWNKWNVQILPGNVR